MESPSSTPLTDEPTEPESRMDLIHLDIPTTAQTLATRGIRVSRPPPTQQGAEIPIPHSPSTSSHHTSSTGSPLPQRPIRQATYIRSEYASSESDHSRTHVHPGTPYHGHSYSRSNYDSHAPSRHGWHGQPFHSLDSRNFDIYGMQQPYVAVDPFRPSIAQKIHPLPAAVDVYGLAASQYPPAIGSHMTNHSTWQYISTFIFDIIPRQIYLHLLLRLPSLYFSRVTGIFEEADLSMPEIKKMALETSSAWRDSSRGLPHVLSLEPASNLYLKYTWEAFIDSLMREWKTLNIVSILLVSAILTILQIQSAAADPITRYSALLSLVCALMSLLYGCMFIIRFGTMRKTYKAAEWAEEAQKTKTALLWNVWVLLAMPAIWLSWSIILYLTCIMSFIWRTGTVGDDNRTPQTSRDALGPRIALSVVLAIGMVYFTLIAKTLRKYGDVMDQAWRARVIGWTREKANSYNTWDTYSGRHHNYASSPQPIVYQSRSPFNSYSEINGSARSPQPDSRAFSHVAGNTLPPQAAVIMSHPTQETPSPISGQLPEQYLWQYPPTISIEPPRYQAYKALDLRFFASRAYPIVPNAIVHDISVENWTIFVTDAVDVWDGYDDVINRMDENSIRLFGWRPQDKISTLLVYWNEKIFIPRNLEAVLCQEYLTGYSNSPVFAIYIVDRVFRNNRILPMVERFGWIPEGIDRIDILDSLIALPDGRIPIISARTALFSTANSVDPRVHFQGPSELQRMRRSSPYGEVNTMSSIPIMVHPELDTLSNTLPFRRLSDITERTEDSDDGRRSI
ncbi:hypothetical protein BDQ12DRAFT_140223 [Crucibulum laeve]|uniref:Transmembrane protein n=1 Tax=Crucibulum laeve TaxID=68775 RepID=A0A5C3LX68_9AGAR|nr:hypothetical protein BDQ12DRAFT_140223 [Crucibulum laeve]